MGVKAAIIQKQNYFSFLKKVRRISKILVLCLLFQGPTQGGVHILLFPKVPNFFYGYVPLFSKTPGRCSFYLEHGERTIMASITESFAVVCQKGNGLTFISIPVFITCYHVYFVRLDKRSEKSEHGANKRWKRTKSRTGEPVEKEPPSDTPKWALSDEWKEIVQRREQEQTEE